MSTQRTIVYVDGFNLYFGLVEQGWRKYLWLDIEKFARSILRVGQHLKGVKYFTSRISGPSDKQKRQNLYLSALKTLTSVRIIEGRYQSDKVICHDCVVQIRCPQCGRRASDSNEKMTDVNIATQMLSDAFGNHVDEIILVTGDADQVPAVERVRALFGKPVYACFPPQRKSYHLEKAVTGVFVANEEAYRKSQFPAVLTTQSGFSIVKPDKWSRK